MPRVSPFLFLAVSSSLCLAQQTATTVAGPASGNWVATWATSQQAAPDAGQPVLDPAKLTDMTVRQVVHLSAGGTSVRVILSNAFGTQPLVIDAAAVALGSPGSSAITPGSGHPLTFSGRSEVTIPAGAVMLSDPLAWPVAALTSLAITFHLPSAPSVQTAHPGSRATSYLLPGNHVADADLPGAEKVVRWMQLAEVDVTGPTAAIVALGDSITDGHASTTDGNDRWTDFLAARLQGSRATRNLAEVNEGIGGNHLLTNGIGQSVLERFDRDVLAVEGVRYIIVFEGINDLGGLGRMPSATPEQHADLVHRMEAAYVQIIERAHAHGIKVYGATITPDGGSGYYHPNADDEAARQAVNAWIKQPGHFDGFIDLDAVVRDPAHPDHMLPAYDSGDHLHPGPTGYKAIGDAIPPALFR